MFIWTGNGLDSRANTALIFWRHEGFFIQRGAGGRIVYSFSFISIQCCGFEHLATAHLKATHWISGLVDVHGNNCQAGTQMIFHSALFFRCRLSASLRSTSSEGFFNSSSFLLMANICIRLISTWINSCFNLCQLMTAEFCPSNMRSKPFWYSMMLVRWYGSFWITVYIKMRDFHSFFGGEHVAITRVGHISITSWWFQPIWKKLVKLDHFPK